MALSLHAQITFDEGYFIDNTGTNTTCLIKNLDWSNNPTSFHYKLQTDGEVLEATIDSVQEFGMITGPLYQRATVNIDRSSRLMEHLSTERKPDFKEETLFLKKIVDGPAKLYSYKDGELIRYFYETTTQDLEQLVYKQFKTNQSVVENNQFRQQLYLALQCDDLSQRSVQSTPYKEKELRKIFTRYNQCIDPSYEVVQKEKRDLFNLSIRPGINYSELVLNHSTGVASGSFDKQLDFRLGIEAEFILPFNKNKWALLIEPTYQSFKADDNFSGVGVEINYSSIEIPLGIRHYFFLSDDSKLFVNACYIPNIPVKKELEFTRNWEPEISTTSSLGVGIGFKFKSKFSAEFRYQSPRELIANDSNWGGDHEIISFILGYTLF